MNLKETRKLAYMAKYPSNCFKSGAVVLSMSSHLAKFKKKSFSLNAEDNGCKNSTSLHIHYRANGKYDEMGHKTKEYKQKKIHLLFKRRAGWEERTAQTSSTSVLSLILIIYVVCASL